MSNPTVASTTAEVFRFSLDLLKNLIGQIKRLPQIRSCAPTFRFTIERLQLDRLDLPYQSLERGFNLGQTLIETEFQGLGTKKRFREASFPIGFLAARKLLEIRPARISLRSELLHLRIGLSEEFADAGWQFPALVPFDNV